jgi:hypothetical protein
VVTIVFAIAGIVRQQHTSLPLILRRIPWFTLALTAVFIAIAIGYAGYQMFNNPNFMIDDLDPLNDPALLLITIVSTGIWVSLGAIGLLHLKRFRAERAAAQAPPPVVGQFTA